MALGFDSIGEISLNEFPAELYPIAHLTWDQEKHRANPTPYIELIEIDTTVIDPVNGEVFRFTPMTDGANAAISFGGNTYDPFPFTLSGFALAATNQAPRPKIQLSNINKALYAIVTGAGDFVNAKFTRIRTNKRFLDGQVDADSTQHAPIETYFIEAKTNDNTLYIEWELRLAIDRQGQMLPGRQMLKDQGFPGLAVAGL